jgi:transposase
MTNLNIFAGLDISKKYFDLSILSAGKPTRSAKFSNDPAGFEELQSAVATTNKPI